MRPTSMAAWLLAAALGILAALTATSPASAHAQLTGSDPRNGAVLSKAPSAVTISFGEELNPTAVQLAVTDARGKKVASKAAQVEGSGVRQDITLPGPGKYTVAYRVVSADGHPVQGAISFTVSAGANSVPSANSGTPTPGTSPTAGQNEELGAVSGEPGPTATATSTAKSSRPAKASDADEHKVWPWIVIGVVIVALAGIAVALATGGRPRSRS
jgi:methionine-rich copper-binding protein CopC